MNKKRKLVETPVNDIPTKQIGGHKYYVDSTPEKKTMSAGNYDTDGYTTHISPDEFESMQDYDDSLGYDYEPGNEEPICYDPIDGPCYDSGDYYSKDLPLQRDYAKYRHHMSDIPKSEKKRQMDNDWSKYYSPNEIPNESYLDLNLNTWDNGGNMSMNALSDDKAGQYGRAQTGSTLRSYLKNLKNESYKGRTNKVRLTESQLHAVVEESVRQMLSELDWKTYQNAAIKAQEFRDKNPYAYDRNRNFDFQHKAADEFYKKHGLEGQFDGPRYGGNKGTVNLNNSHLRNKDELEVTGSRDHNFGDENPHGLNHNVYHFGKKYGIDGGYGRTRMWDYAHDSTPEEFYGNKEMAQKFRNAEKDVEDYKSGKSKYIKGKGWQ